MALLPVLLATQALSAPPALATRTATPPTLDGRLDDAVWARAKVHGDFVQHFPHHGAPPSEPTRVRILYDDEALYFGVECVQKADPITARLTRRDRAVETDSVLIGLDTRGDRKGAFVFQVSAAGTLSDLLIFDDTNESLEWDENWRARVERTAEGWSAEILIPLRTLRFSSDALEDWGVQVRRHVTARQEDDEFGPTPQDAASVVPYFVPLRGLSGLASKGGFELRPFVLGRVLRHDPEEVELASGWHPRGSLGLDVKWHATESLTLDAAILPDFGQVEADQVVLNLSTFETFFPEKRPFFQEGLDLFGTPMPLLYTRRIGRGVSAPALPGDDRLVEPAEPVPIYAATKLSGEVGGGLSVAQLSAVTGQSTVLVRRADGREVQRVAEPLSAFQALRLRKDVGERAQLGLFLSSVSRLEAEGTYPDSGDRDALGRPLALCPSGDEVPFGARCTNDAYVGSLDARLRSASGDYVAAAQVVASVLDQGPARYPYDGSVTAPGEVGRGAKVRLAKEGGGNLRVNLSAAALGRDLDFNDLGYMRRQNMRSAGLDVGWETTKPFWKVAETSTWGWVYEDQNLDGLTTGRGTGLETNFRWQSGLRTFVNAGYDARAHDDREIGDGSAFERSGTWFENAGLSTDAREDVVLNVRVGAAEKIPHGFGLDGLVGVSLRPLPQLDLEVEVEGSHAEGEDRFVGTDDAGYLFGRLRADTLGLTLRTTLTFTPELSLQTYAQAFLAATRWSQFTAFSDERAGVIIDIEDLASTTRPEEIPDFEDAVLNANVVLRYEYALGSTLFFVYSHAQDTYGVPTYDAPGALRFRLLEPRSANDVFLVKASYWWGG